MVDLRINETLQTGAVRKPHVPFYRLVGTVSNSADAVRLETAPTGGESVYLFLEFTIITFHASRFTLSLCSHLRIQHIPQCIPQ